MHFLNMDIGHPC